MPGESAGVPNSLWPRLWSILMRRNMPMQQSPIADRPQFEQEGQPLFMSQATAATPVEEPQPQTIADLFQRQGVEPRRSTIGGQPTLPEPMHPMTLANMIGRTTVPAAPTVREALFGNNYVQQHPRLSRMLEGGALATQDFDNPLGALIGARMAEETDRRTLPGRQLQSGLGTVNVLDAMRRAQMNEDQDAQMFPLDLAYRQAATEELTRRNQEGRQAASLAQMRAELANLESIPMEQRTPEQNNRIMGLRRGLASTSQSLTPYGTSPLGVRAAIKERELGRPLTSAELNALADEIKEDQPVYTLYPVVTGTNSDGSPRVQYLSPAQAQGMQQAKTMYNTAGVGSTAGTPFTTSPPPVVPEGTQINLAGWAHSIQQIESIEQQLDQAEANLGPLLGRITLAEVERLGGFGASEAEIQLATDLRRLLMSQAFAEGGKQLTDTEKIEFAATNPAMTDTFPQAIIKARQAKKYLADRYNIRVQTLGARQRPQVPAAPPKAGGAAAPAAGTAPKVVIHPDGRIEVQ